jgi:hypothetical protein
VRHRPSGASLRRSRAIFSRSSAQAQAALAGQLAGTGIYAGDPALLAAAQDRLLRIDEELGQALERWEALGSC